MKPNFWTLRQVNSVDSSRNLNPQTWLLKGHEVALISNLANGQHYSGAFRAFPMCGVARCPHRENTITKTEWTVGNGHRAGKKWAFANQSLGKYCSSVAIILITTKVYCSWWLQRWRLIAFQQKGELDRLYSTKWYSKNLPCGARDWIWWAHGLRSRLHVRFPCSSWNSCSSLHMLYWRLGTQKSRREW